MGLTTPPPFLATADILIRPASRPIVLAKRMPGQSGRNAKLAIYFHLHQKLKMRGFIPPLPLRPDGVACDSAHGQRLLCVFVIIIIIIIMCKRFWVVSRRHFWC